MPLTRALPSVPVGTTARVGNMTDHPHGRARRWCSAVRARPAAGGDAAAGAGPSDLIRSARQSRGLAHRREEARWQPTTEHLRRSRSASSSTGSSAPSGPRISAGSCRCTPPTSCRSTWYPHAVCGRRCLSPTLGRDVRVLGGRIGYEVSDLHITTAGDVAFSHSLNRMSGTATSGQATSMWVRWTACFRMLDGRWLITHEQVSVPSTWRAARRCWTSSPPRWRARSRRCRQNP
jgi:SnoaL-like protein